MREKGHVAGSSSRTGTFPVKQRVIFRQSKLKCSVFLEIIYISRYFPLLLRLLEYLLSMIVSVMRWVCKIQPYR